MEESVADGISNGWIAEVVVPLGHRELAGPDRRAEAVAVFHDLEQVPPFHVMDGREPPVVEHQDVGAGEAGEQLCVGAVRTRESELVEEPRGSAIEDAVAAPAGLLGQGAGDVGFADTCRSPVTLLITPLPPRRSSPIATIRSRVEKWRSSSAGRQAVRRTP